ncbi:MAG: nucleoside hydrolase, partial [Erysipelotrichaceae bacterium]
MEKRKIIIDTDPGIDDAYALITAMKYEGFDVMGITTVAGNKGLSYTTDNALKLVHLLQYDTMVYAGAKYSLGAEKEEEDAGDTHGVDGLGGVHME